MALTKEQKKKQLESSGEAIKNSKSLIFADFSGVDTGSILKLKNALKKLGANFKVVKKRLLKLAFKAAGMNFDPSQFESQVGTVFSKEDLNAVASTVYKFSKDLAKEKKEFKILGAYDLVEKSYLDTNQFTIIAKLPSREVLLAQVMGGATGPLRAFLYLLLELSKKQPTAEANAAAMAAPIVPAGETVENNEVKNS